MLKCDEENTFSEKLNATQLKAENILDRQGLQEDIVSSRDLFRNEIGLPSAFPIGDEINSHASVKNSIDLLAFVPDNSSLFECLGGQPSLKGCTHDNDQ